MLVCYLLKKETQWGTEGIQHFGPGFSICTFLCSRTTWDWRLMFIQREVVYILEQQYPVFLWLFVVFFLHEPVLHSESITYSSQRPLVRSGEAGSAMGVHRITRKTNSQAGWLHMHTCRSSRPGCLISNQLQHEWAQPCITPINQLYQKKTISPPVSSIYYFKELETHCSQAVFTLVDLMKGT